jgi:chromosome segregation ATPase
MNVDDLLRLLAPLTPAVLPVIVFVWYRTRRELREIRQELVALRQESLPLDPRLDELLEAVEAIRAEVARLTDTQSATLRLLTERQPARPRLEPGSTAESV